MQKNHQGKAATIFLVIFAILLVSLTAVSLFFFQKETERRKMLELVLEKNKTDLARLEVDVKELKKNNFLLEEKNKEADERVNSLLDELELQKGLSEEIKAESSKLKEQLAKEIQEKEEYQKALGGANPEDVAQTKVKLEAEMNLRAQAEAQVGELQQKISNIEQQMGKSFDASKNTVAPEIAQANKEIELEKIVVDPKSIPDGRVLSVDNDTEFLILNLGAKDGVKPGFVMSVFRGQEYLGDVKVTRVQPEMAAADFIPPFSSRKVRKSDQVVYKQ